MRTFAVALAVVTLAAAEPLTLDQAIARATAGNPEAQAAAGRLAEARARLTGATSAFLPALQLGATYLVTDHPPHAFMGLISHGGYAPTTDPNDPPVTDNLAAQATVLLPLFRPGAWQGRRAAAAGVAAADAARDAVRDRLEQMAVETFVAVHRAAAQAEAARAGLAAAEAHAAAARARVEVGSLHRGDLLLLEARVAAARGRLVAADGGRAQAAHALAAVLGDGGAVEPLAPPPALALPGQDEAAERDDLIAARRTEVAARADHARATAARWLPQAHAFAGVGHDRGWRQDGEDDSWSVGVSVEWRAFDGLRSDAAIAEARARAQQAIASRRQLELAAGRAVADARTRVAVADGLLAAAEAGVAAAVEGERLTADRFAAGAATAADVASAGATLTDARLHLAEARAERTLAIAGLRFALGLPIVIAGVHP